MAPGEGRDRTDPQPGPLPGQPRAPPRERLHPQARPPPHPGLPGHSRGMERKMLTELKHYIQKKKLALANKIFRAPLMYLN